MTALPPRATRPTEDEGWALPEMEAEPPSRVAAPLLPTLLALAALLPQGLNIRPANILLTMPRLVLLAALPVVAMRLARSFRFCRCDAVVLAAGFWMFLSVSVTQGITRAAVGASVMILEFCGSYFLTRTTLSRPGQAAAVARLLAIGVAIDGALSVLDVIARRPVLHDLADALTGYDQPWQEDYRHGLMRALGMQEHPIMLGTICVIGGLLALTMLRGPGRVAVLLGCLTGLVTSNSSAPIMGFVIGCGLLVYARVTAGMAARWQVLMIGIGTVLLAFFTLHPAPFSFLIMHTTSVPQDGFYRLLIWNLVGPLVLASPYFGLGLESDFATRFGVNNTIDCFWLASSVNFGIIGSALFGLTLLTACDKPVRRAGTMTEGDQRLGLALGIIVFQYFFIGLTVHFWGTVWILLGVFAGMRANLGEMSVTERLLEEEEAEDGDPAEEAMTEAAVSEAKVPIGLRHLRRWQS